MRIIQMSKCREDVLLYMVNVMKIPYRVIDIYIIVYENRGVMEILVNRDVGRGRGEESLGLKRGEDVPQCVVNVMKMIYRVRGSDMCD